MGIIRRGLEKGINALGYRAIRNNNAVIPLKGYSTSGLRIPNIERLSDADLTLLNELLPWSSFLVDSQGRRFGKPFSEKKRNIPETLPDPRILDLNRKIPLADLTVMEVGCFEGNHTVSLAQLAARVIAVDSRIEHVVKTLVRCAMFDLKPDVYCVDLERDLPPDLDLSCDVLHHVGVLYHLTDPVRHLMVMSGLTRKALLLDTHIAPSTAEMKSYSVNGKSYDYFRLPEAGAAAPFAGMLDHAKWLRQDQLLTLLEEIGFRKVEIVEERQERNGPRIQLLATR